MALIEKIVEADAKYPNVEKNWSYGTAGFRAEGSELDRVCFRIGLLTAFKAKAKGRMGVQITASHNPKQDNGVKIIENTGHIFDSTQESFAEDLINTKDLGTFLLEFDDSPLRKKLGFEESVFAEAKMGRVLVGMDTRESSPRLSQAVISACHLLKVNVTNFDKVTTPMLHWYVQNDITIYKNKYHENFGQAFVNFMKICDSAED